MIKLTTVLLAYYAFDSASTIVLDLSSNPANASLPVAGATKILFNAPMIQ